MNRKERRAEDARKARYCRIMTKVLKYTAMPPSMLTGSVMVREAYVAYHGGVISRADLDYVRRRTVREAAPVPTDTGNLGTS